MRARTEGSPSPRPDRAGTPRSAPADRLHLLLVQPSAELYGADRAMLSALPELTEAFDVTLAVAATGPAVARAQALGAKVVVLPDFAIRRRHLQPSAMVPWFARIAAAMAQLTRLHRRERFDLIYSNTLVTTIGPLLSICWRIPHLSHVHESPEADPRFLRALLFSIRMGTDRVVCNSEATRQYVIGHQPAMTDRTLVVHNGIDLPEPGPPAPPPPDGPEHDDRLRVVCVARIHPKKGQGMLIEAARMLASDGLVLDLHFYGDHLPEHQELWEGLLEQVDRADLTKFVTWHGFIDDTAAMYRDADLAIVPSVMPEEFSLVCVEAQSMRLPVIATGPGGTSEVIVDGETGIIVPPRDPEALAAAIAHLADRPELRAEMGRRGRARMEANFSRSPFGQRMRDLVLDMAATPSDPSVRTRP